MRFVWRRAEVIGIGFLRCAQQMGAQGNDIAAAYHAALALEWDCDWVSTDRGFRRFKGLRVRHPLK